MNCCEECPAKCKPRVAYPGKYLCKPERGGCERVAVLCSLLFYAKCHPPVLEYEVGKMWFVSLKEQMRDLIVTVMRNLPL